MLENKKIRLATEVDSDFILQIYAPYIQHTAITFECKVPTITEFRERMANIQSFYPWLVCEINNQLVGYAYASRFREKEAYKWSVEFSVYIVPEYHKRNIGKALYFALSELLKLQSIYNAYAGVTLPNIQSEGLHESFGFNVIGVYHNVGYKFGLWRDVKWYELNIQEHSQLPENPKSIHDLNNTNEFKAIIEKAEKTIKIG